MALSRPVWHDRTAVNKPFDVDRLQSLLQTNFVGRSVTYRESVDTTMGIAAEEAAAGAPEGAIVLAEEQTVGRGRMGRSWVSPPGVSLYFTLVLRPTVEQLRYMAVIAPLAVSLAIEETTGLTPRIKWPNDVLIGDRKVSGVLIEAKLTGDEVQHALIGIGINVNLDVTAHAEIREIATSLRVECGEEVQREEVLAATLNHIEDLYKRLRAGEAVSVAWKERLDTLGKHVRVTIAGGESQEGVAIHADSDGSLIIRRDDGSHGRVEAGEVTLRDS